MSREDDLRDVLNETAKEFTRFDGNPSTWLSWITYLLAQLQSEAVDVNPMYQELYDEMLARLQDNIRNRLRQGGW
jgi:hypothetical protein